MFQTKNIAKLTENSLFHDGIQHNLTGYTSPQNNDKDNPVKTKLKKNGCNQVAAILNKSSY